MATKTLNVVMLAGGLRATAFRQQLGIPTLCLPVSHDATLLDAWLSCLAAGDRPCVVDIVVSLQSDVDVLAQRARRSALASPLLNVRVVTDPAPWRGTGGLLKDVTRRLGADACVVAVESSCLPPASLEPALDALSEGVSGVVCSASNHEPAGVYVFRREALDLIPGEGFFDLKEQFVPRLYEQDRWLRCAVISGSVARLRDRASYLHALHGRLNGRSQPVPQVAGDAAIAPGARLVGACVVEAGVVVEDGAVVHESVIMGGARVGAGAVVSRSIVGMNAGVPAGAICRDAVEPARGASAGVRPEHGRRRRITGQAMLLSQE